MHFSFPFASLIGALVISAYAVCPDITATVTPDLEDPDGKGIIPSNTHTHNQFEILSSSTALSHTNHTHFFLRHTHFTHTTQ